MSIENDYRILGLNMTASFAEIKKSYRKLAHQYHPDLSRHSNDKKHFMEITAAYAALKSMNTEGLFRNMGGQANNIELPFDARGTLLNTCS
jgi:curved DNA-binding protein